MEFLKMADAFLALRPVRWSLMVLALLLALALVWLRLSLKATERGLESARAEASESRAFLAVQNAAVLDLQAQGEKARVQAEAAVAAAGRERARYDALAGRIMNLPAPADCEEARRYGVELAREIVKEGP